MVEEDFTEEVMLMLDPEGWVQVHQEEYLRWRDQDGQNPGYEEHSLQGKGGLRWGLEAERWHLLEDAKMLNVTLKELSFILSAKEGLESFAQGLEVVRSMFEPFASAACGNMVWREGKLMLGKQLTPSGTSEWEARWVTLISEGTASSDSIIHNNHYSKRLGTI